VLVGADDEPNPVLLVFHQPRAPAALGPEGLAARGRVAPLVPRPWFLAHVVDVVVVMMYL